MRQVKVLLEDVFRRTFMASVDHTACNGSVAVDAAVAEERPIAADIFHCLHIDLANQDLLAVVRGLRDHASEGVGEEGASPKFQASALCAVATNVSVLEADPVHYANVDAIGYGMCALDGSPRIMLSDAEFGLLRGMPSDGGRIKQYLRSLERRETRTLGIPLVPANECPYLPL